MVRGSSMRRLSLREVKHNWFQYLSMIFIVALAVTLFTGFYSNEMMLKERVDQLFSDSNIWDLNTYVTAFTPSDVTYFDSLDETLEYRLFANGTMNNGSAKIYIGDNTLSHPVVLEGNPGVLVDEVYAISHGILIGDTIQLEFTDYNYSIEVEITGFMRFAEVASIKSNCPVYITLSEHPELETFYNLYKNQVLIQTNDITTVKQDILDHFSGASNYLFTYELDQLESYAQLQTEVDQSKQMIYVFPIIFLVVSILVILTTISQLILRERTNIGTLKALGYSNFAIGLHYSSVGILVSMIGAGIGALIGPQIIPHVMSVKYALLYNLPTVEVIYEWNITLASFIGFGILSSLISIYSCHDVLRERPAECMRPKVPSLHVAMRLIGSGKDE